MFIDRAFIPCYGSIYNIVLTHHLFCFTLKASPFIKVISERQRVWILISTEKLQYNFEPYENQNQTYQDQIICSLIKLHTVKSDNIFGVGPFLQQQYKGFHFICGFYTIRALVITYLNQTLVIKNQAITLCYVVDITNHILFKEENEARWFFL